MSIFESYMNRLLPPVFFLVFMVASFALNAQPKPGTLFPSGQPGVDYNKKDSKGKRNGLWVQQWKDTRNMLYRGQYEHGKPVGAWERYYPDGALAATINHVQDTTIMDAVFYHAGGTKKASEGRFVKKKKEGNWKIWNESGALVSDENFKDSLLDGSCKYFFENGQLLKIETFKSGVLEGAFTEYYDSGKKKAEGVYAGGEKDGAYKQWFESGTLDCEGKYYKGLQDGMWYYSHSNGKPKIAVLYKRGTETKRKYENGTFKEYYESLLPKSEYSYENGMRSGPFTEWYDVGQFVQVPASDEDVKEGIIFREKLEGTQVKMKGDYVDDKLEGEVVYYRENGAIEKIEEWVEGKCIKTRAAVKF